MKIDIDEAKKNIKEIKEDYDSSVAELMDGIIVQDIADDLTTEEVVVKEDANKSKGKSVIHQTIQKCYYSALAFLSKKKLENQEQMKEKIEPKQEKEIKKIEKDAIRNNIDLLSDKVISAKAEVYKNGQEKTKEIDSAIEQTKQDIESYEQEINSIGSNSNQLDPVDTTLLSEAAGMESIDNNQIEQQVIDEVSRQIGDDVQAVNNDTKTEIDVSAEQSSVIENEGPSIKEERDKEIETIITTLHTEVEGIYQKLNEKIEETYKSLNNEVTVSYEQITSKTEMAMKRLEQLKESHRKVDIQTISSQSEKMILSVGEKLAQAENRQKETNANLKQAESTITSQNNSIESMQGEINNLNETVSTKDKEIQSLKQELLLQQQRNTELVNENKKLTVTVVTLKKLPQDMDDLLPDEELLESAKTK